MHNGSPKNVVRPNTKQEAAHLGNAANVADYKAAPVAANRGGRKPQDAKKSNSRKEPKKAHEAAPGK